MPVAVKAARRGDIAKYYSATATLEAERRADVLARAAGLIEAIHVEEGDAVEENDLLLRIGNDEYKLRLEQAEATTSNLQSQFERLKKMQQGLVSAEEFDTAKNDLAKAVAEQGLARLSYSYAKVSSPFSGRVVRRFVDVGQYVEIGAALFTVADLNPLLARVYVPAKEFKAISVDQRVELVLDSDGARLQGRIKLISPVIDPATGTITITVEIAEYPANTRPGDFAKVQILTERRTGVTLVPKEAVFEHKGDQVAFVSVGGEAERRVVEVGFRDDVFSEVISGVDADELVVIKGQRSLQHGQKIKFPAASQVATPGAAPDTPSS